MITRGSNTDTGSDKGVSEVIGYVLVVGIILTSIAIVYTNAVPALQGTQDREHIKNTERTFNTLQGNINEVVERGVPQRATEVRLWDAEMSVGETSTWINVTNETGSGGVWVNRTHAPLKYEMEGEKVVYENGAVIRASDNSSGMLKEPNWVIREDTNGKTILIIPTIRTTGSGDIGGRGSVLVRASLATQRSPLEEDITENLTYTVNSEYTDAWRSYFEKLEREDEGIGATIDEVSGSDKAKVEFIGFDKIIYTEWVLSNRISS